MKVLTQKVSKKVLRFSPAEKSSLNEIKGAGLKLKTEDSISEPIKIDDNKLTLEDKVNILWEAYKYGTNKS